MLPFTSAGERGVAVRDGVAGRKFTGADSGFRRTACIHPRPRVSAGLRFAVILLSKAMDVVRDHLIHRKRSPFPYEGKDLTRPDNWARLLGRAHGFTLREGERV